METLVETHMFNIIKSMETFVLFLVTFVLMFLLNWSCYTLANVNLCQRGKYKNPLVLAINGTELHCPLRRDVVCLPSPMPYHLSGTPGPCCGWTAALLCFSIIPTSLFTLKTYLHFRNFIASLVHTLFFLLKLVSAKILIECLR